MSKIVVKNPSRALDNTAVIATVAASRFPENVLPTLTEVINFYHTGTRIYFGKLALFMLYRWTKEQIVCTLVHR